MILTEENFQYSAAKVYRKRLSVSTQAFLLDLNHLDIRADIVRYNNSKETRLLRVLINKIIIACNLFGPDAADLILFKLQNEHRIFACHLFSALNILNEDLELDEQLSKEINEALSKI